MSLQAFVILSTGEVSASVHAGIPPGADTPKQTPPRSRHSPPEQTPPLGADSPLQSRHPPGSWHPPEQTPPRSGHPPGADTPLEQANTPLGSRLRHTVNERPVRILLECILVRIYRYASSTLVATGMRQGVSDCEDSLVWNIYTLWINFHVGVFLGQFIIFKCIFLLGIKVTFKLIVEQELTPTFYCHS